MRLNRGTLEFTSMVVKNACGINTFIAWMVLYTYIGYKSLYVILQCYKTLVRLHMACYVLF